MTPLFSIIRDIIGNEGPITLERYMEIVLHHPDFGYYRHRNPLGASGDFITAPEISQMFGELIGLWCVEVWHKMGKPDPFVLLEMGPGRAMLMHDLLRATAKVADFQKALRLHLLESNIALRKMQIEKLGDYAPVFIESLDQLPAMPMLALANEFFDTMPMRQFVKTEGGWKERKVDCRSGTLLFTDGEINEMPGGAVESESVKDGWIYEVSPASLAMMRQLSAHLLRAKGAALVVDYGYHAPAGTDTVQALHAHKFVSPLDHPGEADVTADVDFGALRHVAEHTGLRVEGPIGQGELLQNLGIDIRADHLKHNASPENVASIDADVHRLIDPSQMGTLFKAMAFLSPEIKDVPGF